MPSASSSTSTTTRARRSTAVCRLRRRASNAAVDATAGQIVEYGGAPALTYFFSSSGGYTESIQNVWQGVAPEAWLHGVPDPYDDSLGNPYYRWKETLSVGAASGDLKRYLKGSLKGIEVLQHGVSPRVVKAAIVGSKGTVDVSGQQLQTLFGLRSTYVAFTTITSKGVVSSGTLGSGSGSVGTVGSAGSAGPGGSGGGSAGTGSEGGAATSPGSGYAASGGTGLSGDGSSTSSATTPGQTTTTTPRTSSTPTSTTGAVAAAAAVRNDAITDPAPAPFTNAFAVSAAFPTVEPAVRITRELLSAAREAAIRARKYAVAGTTFPASPGSVLHVQRQLRGGWRAVARGHVTLGGTYSVRVKRPGSYRVVMGGVIGPAVTVS